jgi:hypothetical protein
MYCIDMNGALFSMKFSQTATSGNVSVGPVVLGYWSVTLRLRYWCCALGDDGSILLHQVTATRMPQ